MRNTNRMIALALCCTLTLGAFAYRPPEAKAVAGVDDAIVISALLSAFGCGVGLIFSNNGMTSNEIADGMTKKWDEYKAMLERTPDNFADWLGYEDMDALLADCKIKAGDTLTIPKAMARKLKEFADWLNPDASSIEPAVITGRGVSFYTAQFYTTVWNHETEDVPFRLMKDVYNPSDFPYKLVLKNAYGCSSSWPDVGTFLLMSKSPFELLHVKETTTYDKYGKLERGTYIVSDVRSIAIFWFPFPRYEVDTRCSSRGINRYFYQSVGDYDVASEDDGVFSLMPNTTAADTDLAGDGTVDVSNVGDGNATSVEELLQQILDQLQTNTLAPTLTVDGTQTGDNTGTDTGEDAKPYLPYIPQIFEKIKDIPGTLSNIWETIKGIPAAVAEKIGAFFTTLWGWLQDIIDEIKSLPAAIAEKVKALFIPHEGYAAEFVADITSTYQGRMGLLTYPFTVLADFVSTVSTLDEQEPVLRWDAVKWHDKTLIAAGEYNLKSAVSSAQMQTIYMIYQTVISGVLVVAFLHLCYKKLKEVQRN